MRYKSFCDKKLSELGLGTYLGELDEETDRRYAHTIELALEKDINVIDTAINYRYMKSERVIGDVLSRVGRERAFVSTKGGYIPYDANSSHDPKVFFEENFLKSGLINTKEMTPQGHYLGGEFIRWCFEKSLENLRADYIDVYFLHNPEEQLLFIERDRFYSKLGECFEVLEEKRKEGSLRYYGIATWHGLRVPKGARQHLDIGEILSVAKEIGGEGHGFRFVQLPYNLGMHEAFSLKNQVIDGREVSTLQACTETGLYVYTSASLHQGGVLGRVNPTLKDRFGIESDVLVALQFVRSTPGVGTALVGMSRPEHLEENVRIADIEPLGKEEFYSLLK